jgi:DNA-directed RNA polymerase
MLEGVVAEVIITPKKVVAIAVEAQVIIRTFVIMYYLPVLAEEATVMPVEIILVEIVMAVAIIMPEEVEVGSDHVKVLVRDLIPTQSQTRFFTSFTWLY